MPENKESRYLQRILDEDEKKEKFNENAIAVTTPLTFKEAMGSSYEKFEFENGTITITDPGIAISSEVIMSDGVEISESIDSFDVEQMEIDFDPEAPSAFIWKFDAAFILDLMDEIHQKRVPLLVEEVAEKTAPKSLTTNFEDNRDPRLGTLAQKEGDDGF